MLRILTKGGDNEDASFDWVTCATAAVLQLSPLSIRHLKGACKGPKKAPAKASKSTSGKHGTGRSSEGGEDGKVYVVLEDNVAVDLLWLASVLPRHILNTLIAEVVPPAATPAGTSGGSLTLPNVCTCFAASCSSASNTRRS